MKSVILLVLIFVNTSLVMAVPETNKVIRLLEGRHWELREGPFKRLGEGADQRLREIADNTSLTNYLRFRALIALSLYDNEETGVHLERHARSGDSSFARRGFSSLTRAFSRSQPDRVRKVAEHLMESPEAQLRIAAAREMRKIDPPTFQKFLQRESKAWVREAARE